ncbi:MAG TPA: glycosyl transferase family 1 [Flavobacteriaceae bacterium]|nr:glycosyl transferase family 1 [Flavobacteriaceae bacterium]
MDIGNVMVNTINLKNPLRVTFIASYPPRKCGIATFTADLFSSMQGFYDDITTFGKQEKLQIIAMNNTTVSPGYNYDREVSFEIREQHQEDYYQAADFINLSFTDVVSLQHEFGIFGGKDGNYIIHLLQNLKKPLVTTLHTVLEKPTQGQLKTLKEICRLSSTVIVQTEKAVNMMKDIYDVPAEKIVMIHHGTPDVPFLDSFYYKEQFQAEGKKVILTFGLLSASKGIEYVIKALPEVIAEFPNLLFIILGVTHPAVKEHSGEEYRHFLKKMISDNNIEEKNVVFYNQYVTLERLLQFMEVTDIYISPYINKEQIVSGTLAYALACGKAIISTPYWHAEALLSDGRGILVSFRDSQSITKALKTLLRNDTLRNQMRKKAYQFGRRMIWQKTTQAYLHTFRQALFNYTDIFVHPSREKDFSKWSTVPKINLSQMRTLTDDTGFYQHAIFTMPNRQHGYCTDDNARALLVSVMNWRIYKDENILPLLYIYLSFLNHALNTEKGRMRNFMSFDREWLEEIGSEDSHGRAIWALGYTVAYPPTKDVLNISIRLFKQSIDITTSFKAPRAWADSLLGSLY